MVLGMGCEHSGSFGDQAHIQGSLKNEAGEVDFEIAIDKNRTKILFERIPNTPDKSSDDEGNPLESKDEGQKDQ